MSPAAQIERSLGEGGDCGAKSGTGGHPAAQIRKLWVWVCGRLSERLGEKTKTIRGGITPQTVFFRWSSIHPSMWAIRRCFVRDIDGPILV